jgi:outer membrane protein OmpA-like peptidoglycan-associated protein
MSGPRASNPTTGPSLLDRSSAHPGSIDMAIFQKKSGGGAGSGQTTGQGTVNSNYLKECREDNPEPSTQDAAATATLLNCKIDTPPEKLVVDQPFEMSVEATGEGVAGGAITFRLFCATASADGKETFEDQSAVWSARAKDGKATFQGELLSPKKSVPLGTKLKYYVQASHPKAKEKAASPKVEAVFGKPPEVLAIWSLGAIHFGFGSSFIMPSVAAEVSHLKKLLDQHSGSALAIFGHADPVGDDDSNKKLSGRRAYALHCLLTRNADGWVELSKGIEGDKWGTKAHQAILGQLKDSSGAPFYGGSIHGNDDTQTKAAIEAYQKSAKLKADGIVGPQTKKSLYAAYMDQLCEVKLKPNDFVGDPTDKLVQWACSGCSEFNPVVVFSKSDEDAFKSSGNKAERDAKNAPNRRASLFLFPATAKGPGKVTFPCPAWSEGTAGCKKQLFADADKRRNPTDAERTWEAAKDTFGCQFYAEIGKGEKAGGAGEKSEFRLQLFYCSNEKFEPGSVKIATPDGKEKDYQVDENGVLSIGDEYSGVVTLKYLCQDENMIRYIAPNPAGVDANEGVWHRLLNLGYCPSYCKDMPDELTLSSSIQAFQIDQSLDPTAELDDATRKKISDVYESTFKGYKPVFEEYFINADQLHITKVT